MPISYDVDEIAGVVAVLAWGAITPEEIFGLVEAQMLDRRLKGVRGEVIDARDALPGAFDVQAARIFGTALERHYKERNGIPFPYAIVVQGAMQVSMANVLLSYPAGTEHVAIVSSVDEACAFLTIESRDVLRLFDRLNSAIFAR
jgi:hypothetical protein